MAETLYKVTFDDGSLYYGEGKWSLPRNGRPGFWMPKLEGDLIACEYGYHLCRSRDLLDWLGEAIWEAEYTGELLESDNKVVVRRARLIRRVETWNERTARLFACDCAEHVLGTFEALYPKDQRPREAIHVARRYANGEASMEELDTAHSAAHSAYSAARSAIHIAGRSAAYAAYSAADSAADSAIHIAARSAAYAAYSAADSAARSAAYAAEREWQTKHLWQYLNGELPTDQGQEG